MKNTKLFMTVLISVLIGSAPFGAHAETDSLPGKTDAPETEPGGTKTVEIGYGEVMAFIWIEPLKIWVGQFEVTNGQYRGYDNKHDSGKYHGYHLNERNQPVVNVSWEDARNYCSWLIRHFKDQIPDDHVFRLPTEKEWEVFASCGDRREFPWGCAWPPPDEWNYRGEEGARGIFRFFAPKNFIKGHNDDFIVSCPVGRSGCNEWALYGVGGNVWEWCDDWFDDNQTSRATRGAAWCNYQERVLSLTNRAAGPAAGKTPMLGFRVVIGKDDYQSRSGLADRVISD